MPCEEYEYIQKEHKAVSIEDIAPYGETAIATNVAAAILDKFGENKPALIYSADWPLGPCVSDDGLHLETGNVSLLWGEDQDFRPRVSRGINSLPKGRLASHPFTVDGYNGEGLCLAYGLLGRNKGLNPARYVFDLGDALKTRRGVRRVRHLTRISTELESSSTWNPRANKVMRSYYTTAVDEQFGTLPEDFRYAAVELALIFLDIEEKPLRTWLGLKLDQQSMAVNTWMSARPVPREPRPRATAMELETLYRASYTSMIISLNYFAARSWLSTSRTQAGQPVRPDLVCFALLLLGDHSVVQDFITGKNIEGPGAARPQWWTDNWVQGRLRAEYTSLKEGWREPAAWLLGLLEFPPELDVARWPSWPNVRYQPS